MAFVTRTDILVGVEITDDGIPAEFRIGSLLHVTAIEPINPPRPRRGKRQPIQPA